MSIEISRFIHGGYLFYTAGRIQHANTAKTGRMDTILRMDRSGVKHYRISARKYRRTRNILTWVRVVGSLVFTPVP
jgi:hypothetical protein